MRFSNAIRATRLCNSRKSDVYWSVRIGLRCHALAMEVDGGYLWFWIGSHADHNIVVGQGNIDAEAQSVYTCLRFDALSFSGVENGQRRELNQSN
jgi:hypothetical protein